MHFKKLLAQSLVWRGFYFVSLLLVNIFLSRYLQADWVGWVYYICNIFTLINLIVSLNLDAGIIYFASGKKIDANKLLWQSLLWCLIVVSVSWIGIRILPLVPLHSGINNTVLLFFALCYIAGILLTNIVTGLFYAQRNFWLPNLILVIINFSLIYFIPKQSNVNNTAFLIYVLHIYFLVFLLQGLLLTLIFILKNKSWQQIKLPLKNDNKKLFRYATVALLGNIVFFLVYRIDYWFVKYYCNSVQLGNYIQVSKLAQMLLIIPQILASAVFPQTAGGYDRFATRETVMTISRLFTALYVVFIFVIILIGKWFFPFVFGPTFNYMYLPILFILPGIWSLSVLALLAAYFSGTGNVKINVIGGILSVIIVVAGNFIFIPKGGIIAAAAVSSVAYFLYMFYLLRRFKASYNVHAKDFIFLRSTDFNWMKSLLQFKKTTA
ncbi:MAG: lipopolysaccharide biosynthesis protein [Chitinophagaceae bacterium]